jgi:ketosteroid isomerase-like protein
VPRRVRSTATSRSGKELAFDEIRIDRFAGGRIVESWFIPDRFTMWNALGLIGGPRA